MIHHLCHQQPRVIQPLVDPAQMIRPRVLEPLSGAVEFVEGGPAVFECRVEGNPLSVQWFRGARETERRVFSLFISGV